VLSRTGYIFERRLIEEHVQRLGTCPVTQEALAESDLTDIKGGWVGGWERTALGGGCSVCLVVNRVVKPRTATATSIPAMLQTFQNEWDALMMETFELRKQLDQVQRASCGWGSALTAFLWGGSRPALSWQQRSTNKMRPSGLLPALSGSAITLASRYAAHGCARSARTNLHCLGQVWPRWFGR
jgi:hypothetical protein